MASQFIDLRSDTVTKPTSAMREAMAMAEVGDDMVGEDPTVNRLEARMAEMFGKQAAVFACSGTQSNQMGVWSHCTAGDELLTERTSHIGSHEAGAPAALSGVSVRHVEGECGRLDVEHLERAVRPLDLHFAPTRLLSLENSTNLGGGRTYPLLQLSRVGNWARERGWKVHLDGARVFNACLARTYSPAAVGACVDTVSICFSKGLGCPMGSVLVGSQSDIARARRARKLFGGALRQAGIVAAAALHAIDHHVERLAEDHQNARLFAEGVHEIEGISVDLASVETNLVFFDLDRRWGSAEAFARRLEDRGVRLYDVGPQRLRACTHLDLDHEHVLRAVEILRAVAHERRASVDGSAANRYP
ncbi:MAG: low specificity L-threonine aldolase [Planctomycetaceae bacterium]